MNLICICVFHSTGIAGGLGAAQSFEFGKAAEIDVHSIEIVASENR